MIAPAPRTDDRTNEPLPGWITEQLIAETKVTWSPKYGRSLTNREAVEILLAFGRLLDSLQGHTS